MNILSIESASKSDGPAVGDAVAEAGDDPSFDAVTVIVTVLVEASLEDSDALALAIDNDAKRSSLSAEVVEVAIVSVDIVAPLSVAVLVGASLFKDVVIDELEVGIDIVAVPTLSPVLVA